VRLGCGEGVERGGLHFDGQKSACPRGLDGGGRFAVGRVGGPTRAAEDRRIALEDGPGERFEFGSEAGVIGRRQIVVARAFIAPRPVEQDEIRGGSDLGELARGGHADQEAAPGGEKLLGDEHGKRPAHSVAHHAYGGASDRKIYHAGVVAGPTGVSRNTPPFESADEVAIRVEETDRRNITAGQTLLPPGLAQQSVRSKDRGILVMFIGEKRRSDHAT